ncbi:MAG TPA: malate dehydrogenase (quinone), partial [Thermomicrobiales bacterium]|nr:malate dehydrogenase (quinone) [Thermomicrobiales bacterium]
QSNLVMIERLDKVGEESSNGWNNAGTGHAALCELHYTPQRNDGPIDVTKAILVNEQFQLSIQFYTWLVENGIVENPSAFINPVPHLGFARGEADVAFLRARHAALAKETLFSGIEFTDDPATVGEWAPLLMAGREGNQPIAATRSVAGTDVNFGVLTKRLVTALEEDGMTLHLENEVTDLERHGKGWKVTTRDRKSGDSWSHTSDFVFVGSGGTAVLLLQKSGIPEIKGIGGFPVSGQFLRCTNPDVIAQHNAKVYGRPATGAPPMTAPHLDSRVIDGQRGLLFGPYAGFTPKFLKQGSLLDLAKSVHRDNLLTMLTVAKDEVPLTTYLVKQVLQSRSDRLEQLRVFYPDADDKDWELVEAGQRVQVMRPTPKKRGILQFGTEVIAAADGSIAGLLGASPGASTATAIMVDILQRCFPTEYPTWQANLESLFPALNADLATDTALYDAICARADAVLGTTIVSGAAQLSTPA